MSFTFNVACHTKLHIEGYLKRMLSLVGCRGQQERCGLKMWSLRNLGTRVGSIFHVKVAFKHLNGLQRLFFCPIQIGIHEGEILVVYVKIG